MPAKPDAEEELARIKTADRVAKAGAKAGSKPIAASPRKPLPSTAPAPVQSTPARVISAPAGGDWETF